MIAIDKAFKKFLKFVMVSVIIIFTFTSCIIDWSFINVKIDITTKENAQIIEMEHSNLHSEEEYSDITITGYLKS